MKVISKEPAGKQRVYDIGVPETHNFILANNLISHNCFNKSHSIAYSLITYICAWLKANYPEEFFCSLMTTRSRSLQPKDWSMKAPEYINEARQLGVNIHPPTINASKVGFTIQNNSVYFGLNAIKNVGIVAARSIIRTRGNIPFKDIYDFMSRINLTSVNTQTFQALVNAGTFDRMGYRREDLLNNTQELYNWVRDTLEYHERTAENKKREKENIELEKLIEKRNELRRLDRLKSTRDLTEAETLFLEETKGIRKHKMLKADSIPNRPEISRHKKITLSVVDLMNRAEYIGCYIGTHPASIIYPNSTRISNALENEKQTLAGVVSTFKKHIDRNKNPMAFIAFGDGTGIVDGVIFASTYTKLVETGQLPEPGDLIEVFGEVTEIDPEVKMKIYSVQKYRSNT